MKNKIDKNTIPQGFTISLAVVDGIPVIFFTLSMIVAGMLFNSKLFIFGALLVLVAGSAKVLWKIIVVLKKKNIWFLFIQMRILMPIGLLLMIAGVILNKSNINMSLLLSKATCFPTVIFFILGILGMILMMIFAFNLDSSDVKSNWIEQITNGIAQICIFIGLLMLL